MRFNEIVEKVPCPSGQLDLTSVCGVIDTVVDGDDGNVEWIYTLKTTYVEPILLRVGTTLVMSVDAAY